MLPPPHHERKASVRVVVHIVWSFRDWRTRNCLYPFLWFFLCGSVLGIFPSYPKSTLNLCFQLLDVHSLNFLGMWCPLLLFLFTKPAVLTHQLTIQGALHPAAIGLMDGWPQHGPLLPGILPYQMPNPGLINALLFGSPGCLHCLLLASVKQKHRLLASVPASQVSIFPSGPRTYYL